MFAEIQHVSCIIIFIRFLPHVLAWYLLWPCVCVCLCVTSQCATKTTEDRITQTKPRSSLGNLVSDAKDLSETLPWSPKANYVKIDDFRQIARYILKMIQDNRIVYIKVEQKVVCTLSNGDIAHDLECPITTPFSAFCTAIYFT